jgi:site-specific DNA recombinase
VTGEGWQRMLQTAAKFHRYSFQNREESLLEGVLGFFSERVFGPNRRDLLEAELRRLGSDDDKEVLRRLRSLEKSIGQAESRQSRLIRSLELDDDPQGAMFRQIRQRMQQLEKERREKLEELEALRREQPDVSPGSPELLDELPVSDEQLVSAPEGLLRDLFDSFRLEVRYNKVSGWAKCRVAINEEGLDGLVAHSAVLLESDQHPAQPPNGKRSLLVGAPGRIRT